jgi:hypothetical protein
MFNPEPGKNYNYFHSWEPEKDSSFYATGSTLLSPNELTRLTPAEVDLTNLAVVYMSSPNLEGSNESFVVTLEGGTQGLFKPGQGEACLEFREACHKLYQREKASYLVDRMFNLDLIPPTVIRTVYNREGSVQQLIDNYRLVHRLSDLSPHLPQLSNLALFDYMTWNRDRKPEHKLASADKIWGIDNGLSFDEWAGDFFSNYLLINLEAYTLGRPVSPELRANLTHFTTSRDHQQSLQAALQPLIPNRSIRAMFARIKHLATVLEANSGYVQARDLQQGRFGVEYFPTV